jgi:hypothetical protein
MLFNLQRRWTGKFKATMVFALRLPFVTSSPRCTAPNLHLSSQNHHYRNLQTLIPTRLSLIYGPLPRPHTPDSMDAGRASVQLRDSNHTIPHALLDEAEHRPRGAFTRGLCQRDDEARVERELYDAVVEAVAEGQHGKCAADMRH